MIGSIVTPEALILGRHDQRGRLRVAGRTTALSVAARREVAAALAPPLGAHPWPATIPSSRFGQRPSELVSYVQVSPTTVVELEVDTAFEDLPWRHPARFVRLRADLRPFAIRALTARS